MAQTDDLRPDASIGTDGTVYVTANGTLYALSPIDGSTKWQYTGAGHSPVFDAARNVVYVGGGGITALNAANGQRLWQSSFGSHGVDDLALGTNGRVYAVSSSDVTACDAATGSVVWTFTTALHFLPSLSLAADNTVYVISDKLYAFDGQTGAKLWERAGTYTGEPATALDGTLFLYGKQGDVATNNYEEYLIGVQ